MHASTGLPPEALARARAGAAAPLVAHVIFRLDTGGLENGLVNLINHMAEERFRHAVICLTGYTRFRERIGRADVPVFALNKAPGNSPLLHLRLWRLFMRLRPDIVHTRNLGTLEAQLPAALAGVPARIHGEHGWDVGDTDGSNRRNRALRRLFRPLVHRYIALSKHLERYLCEGVGVPPQRVLHLCNGVDTKRFHP
ncbi:MAG: glycosyltransferase, partial [Burkholderiales bacterium]|nr:glycosyltransferase [Burkholderiales bacterium]